MIMTNIKFNKISARIEEDENEFKKEIEELKKNPVVKEERRSEIKNVEMWHGVGNEKALQKLPSGKYLLKPHNELNKLWFVPAWNEENRQISMGYAYYALIKIKIPFEYKYVKRTRKNGDEREYLEEYEPKSHEWQRAQHLREYYLHDGDLEVDVSQIMFDEDVLRNILSVSAGLENFINNTNVGLNISKKSQ